MYEDDDVLNASHNWWGDETGPYHPDNNSDGQGDNVSDEVIFDPWSYNVFTEKPEAIIESIVPNPWYVGESIIFNASGLDDGKIVRYHWKSDLEGDLFNDTNPNFNTSLSIVGTHTIFLRVQDDYHIWSDETSTTLEIKPLPIAIIDIITPNPALEFESVSFSGNGSAGEFTQYSWRSSRDGLFSFDKDFNISSLSWGTHTIFFKVRNTDGVWSDEVSAPLLIHRPPEAFIDSIEPPIALFGENVTFDGYGTDDNWIMRMVWESSIDGVLKDGFDYSFTLANLSAGNHTITLRIQDEFGIWSEENKSYVYINQRPQAIIDSILPTENVELTERQFIGHGEDDNAITGYSWRSDLDGPLSDQATFSTDALSNGTHTIYFKVKDEYDVWSEEASTSLTVNGIPRAQIHSISPGSASEGESITFEGYATDDGSIERYLWRSSLNGEIYNGTESTISLSNLSVGEHTIYFRVQDDLGTWSEEVTSIVTIRANLIITITDPSIGETVNGTILIKGEVTPLTSEDDSQILIRIDNGSWEESTGRGYYLNTCLWQYTWMSQSVENGQHTIFTKAYDGENWSNIAQIDVTVENTYEC